MKRIGEAELLDELPPNDPAAMRSRRDLRRVNFWMGNRVIAANALRANFSGVPKQIIELGAGDGTFLLRVIQPTGGQNLDVTLVDRQGIVTPQTLVSYLELGSRANVVVADAFDWLSGADRAEIIVANLFLHHFDDARLSLLFREISERAELFVAIEPRRSAFAGLCGQLLRLIGCNFVTRHDAVVSIRAGFVGREISALWPNRESWRVTEGRAWLFSHLFIARRVS